MVLMGDGFTAAQQGIWPNPARNTFLYRANSAVTFMLNFYPFNLFANNFTVYAVKTISAQPWRSMPNNSPSETTNRFGSFSQARDRLTMPLWGTNQVRFLAADVAGGNHNMIQVIANTTLFGGAALGMGDRPPNVGVALTSVHARFHQIFLHEFGHTFGFLADESTAESAGREAPNMTAEQDESVRWAHWIGHENVGVFSRGHAPEGFAIPTRVNTTMMSYVGSTVRPFGAVASAELVRRLSRIVGETFQVRYMHSLPTAVRPSVEIPSTATRILPYAFNGNTAIQEIEIPEAVETIGRFAFLGATNLRTITNHSTTPQQIDSTTFADVNRSLVNLTVPHGTGLAFREAGWTGFHITEMDGYFEISTREDLWNIRYKPYSNFKLTNDIILSSTAFDWQPDMTWAAEEQWVPIPVFYGTLYGNGYSILGLDISTIVTLIPMSVSFGLFANLNGTVQDLIVSYAQLNIMSDFIGKGFIYAGTIAGRLGVAGVIENVTVTHALVSVTGREMTMVGGLVGESSGTIVDSHVIGAGIQGSGFIGGLVGGMADGVVAHSSFGSFWYLRSLIVSIQIPANPSLPTSPFFGSLGGIAGFHSGGYIHDNLVERITIFIDMIYNFQLHGTIVGVNNFQGPQDNYSVPGFFDNQSLDVAVIVSMPEDGWMLMAPDSMWQRRIPIVNPGFGPFEGFAGRSVFDLSSKISFRGFLVVQRLELFAI